jgi:predicted nucleic acid-binding protein
MKRFVLDAWAVLALLQKEEPAASRVRALLQDAQQGETKAFISMINLGEVFYIVGRSRGEPEANRVLDRIYALPIEVLSAIDDRVLQAAALKIRHQINYADAFAAAAAEELAGALMTGDPELIALKDALPIEILSRRN